MKRYLVAFTLLLVSLCTVSGKGTRETESLPSRSPLQEKNTFSIALLETDDSLYLDPIRATDANSLMILDGLFEGLYGLDPKSGEPELALAKSAQVSHDGLIWTYQLKEDIRYSNGDLITAQSIVSSWLWLLQLSRVGEGKTYLISMLDCIEGVSAYRNGEGALSKVGIFAADQQTIILHLETPAPYLPALLSMKPFAAIHESLRTEEALPAPEKMISSGPYVIDSIDESSVVLAKHAWYDDYEQIPSDYIRFTFLDTKEIIEAYLNQSIHWAQAFIPSQLLRNQQDMRISPLYSTGFYYFSADSGVYSNQRIRQALTLLIPWDEIRRESGQLFPTAQLIPHINKASNENTLSPYEAEDLSFSLLAQEGYPYGAGLPPIHIAVHRGAQVIESAERIADIWSKKLGITVVIDSVPLSTYSRYPELSPYDFSFITWIGDFYNPFAFLHLFSGDSGYNLGKYQDSTYDSLLNQAMVTYQQKEGAQYIQAAQEYLLDSGTVIPIFHGFTINIIRTDAVTGWYDNILDYHPVKFLGIK